MADEKLVVSLFDCTAVNSSLDGDETVVLCPVCGSDYSHIVNVFTRVGSDPFEAGVYRGTKAAGEVGYRRSCLVVVFEGECGHVFEWRVQQHKGNNFVQVAYVGNAETPAALRIRAGLWYRLTWKFKKKFSERRLR